MFMNPIGKIMKIYMDDMLVKNLKTMDRVKHLDIAFQILKRYRMILNPLKCAFGAASKKFLGNMINQRLIEANPKKIKVLIEMRLPQKSLEPICF